MKQPIWDWLQGIQMENETSEIITIHLKKKKTHILDATSTRSNSQFHLFSMVLHLTLVRTRGTKRNEIKKESWAMTIITTNWINTNVMRKYVIKCELNGWSWASRVSFAMKRKEKKKIWNSFQVGSSSSRKRTQSVTKMVKISCVQVVNWWQNNNSRRTQFIYLHFDLMITGWNSLKHNKHHPIADTHTLTHRLFRKSLNEYAISAICSICAAILFIY